MAQVQVGSVNIVWGTTDESYGYAESLSLTEESNGKEEVVNGVGDIVDAVYYGLKTTMSASLVALDAPGVDTTPGSTGAVGGAN